MVTVECRALFLFILWPLLLIILLDPVLPLHALLDP